MSKIIKILEFSQRHSTAVIGLTIFITLLFGLLASQVKISPDINSLVPQDEKVSRLIEKYAQGQSQPNFLVIAIGSEDLFNLEILKAFDQTIKRVETLPNVQSSINPFNLFTFGRQGKKIEIIPFTPGNRAPDSEEELGVFKSRIIQDPFVKNFIISADARLLAAFFPVAQVADPSQFMRKLDQIVNPLKGKVKTYITGSIPFEAAAKKYLTRDLPTLVILCALVILLIYYLGFRVKRVMILPFLIILFGTIWTLGFMRIFGFSISMISIVTPPLVLTLGSSYSIHILSEYYREAKLGQPTNEWITNTVAHINKTILMASLTTVIGFMSLLVTTMKPVRDFAISTSVGILSCTVLSLFFFPAVLSRLPAPTAGQVKMMRHGIFTRGLLLLARYVIKFRLALILLLFALVFVFVLSLPYLTHQSNYVSYFPKSDTVVTDRNILADKLGGFDQFNITLTAPQGDKNYFLQPAVLKQIGNFEDWLNTDSQVVHSISFVTYLKELNGLMTGKHEVPSQRGLILLLQRYFRTLVKADNSNNMAATLVNQDFSTLTISFRVYDKNTHRFLIGNDLRTLINKIKGEMHSSLSADMKPAVWGGSLVFLSLEDIFADFSKRTIAIAIILILIITSISFRSFKFGIYSLIPLITGLMWNFIAMALFKIPLDMTTAMVSSLTIGVGVDNSIHFLIQFRRQLNSHSRRITHVLTNTLVITGRPILLTTASIVSGLLMFLLASFTPISYFGFLMALTLTATAIGTLIVLPAVLSFDWLLQKKYGKKKAAPGNAEPGPDLTSSMNRFTL